MQPQILDQRDDDHPLSSRHSDRDICHSARSDIRALLPIHQSDGPPILVAQDIHPSTMVPFYLFKARESLAFRVFNSLQHTVS
jgi:hypothetical protein